MLSGAHGGTLAQRIHDPEGMGEGVASVGDLDQDGRSEFAFGSRSSLQSGGSPPFQRGAVVVATDPPGPLSHTTIWIVEGSHPLAELGEDVAAIGDRSGDGAVDLVVLESVLPAGGSAPTTLRVHAMSGATGDFLAFRDFPGEAAPGSTDEAELEPIDDVDGDGLADVVLIVPRSGVHGGPEVRVLSGATLATLHAWSVDLQQEPGDLGPVVAASIGDRNGDGAPDLLVGRPNDVAGAGRVLVFPTERSAGGTTCSPAVPSSSGRPADLRLAGSLTIASNSMTLVGNDLPPSTWVLPIAGTVGALVPMAGGSTGTLCVGGAVRRLGAYVARADAGGAFRRTRRSDVVAPRSADGDDPGRDLALPALVPRRWPRRRDVELQ